MAPRYKLSDSEAESEASVPTVPSDKALEQGLRDEVAAILKSGNMDELTVKRVRLTVENKLGLEEGFFKSTDDWKSRSDQIIKDEVEVQDTGPQEVEAERTEDQSPPPSLPKKKAPPKRTKGETTPKPRKRQKTQTPDSEDEPEASEPSDDEAEEEVAKPKERTATPVKKGAKPKPARAESSVASDEEAVVEPTKSTKEATRDESESEMSVVLDEESKPARKRQKSAETSSKKKEKKAAPKAAKGKEEDLDPDQAEIKRLQGWLVKCGIRKMWWRELQPYETPKAKIKHLKQMLEDAGMKGRYSLEKARQIRDERELKADLEQIQQGAKQWGTGSADEGSDGPPRRRAARGRPALAFLESDGEETD